MIIKSGDIINLFHSPKEFILTTFSPEKKISTHLGVIDFSTIKEFGQKVYTHLGEKYYVLRPRISEISMNVKRTTTIVYPKDAGYILMHSSLSFPSEGFRVIEVGSGSGAYTTILALFVGPKGKVYSFERREEFLRNAKKNIEKYGLSDRVEFFLKDPSIDGFGVSDVDFIFIDVPEPWTLIKPAYESLKPGHTLAFLSPNIEQVQKGIKEMENTGFVHIRVYEILEREIMVREGKTRPVDRMVAHTAYLAFGSKVLEL